MEICNVFGLTKDSSAGSIVDRVKKQLKTDNQLMTKVNKIKRKLNKSQTKILTLVKFHFI